MNELMYFKKRKKIYSKESTKILEKANVPAVISDTKRI